MLVHAPGFARAAQTVWWIAILGAAVLAVSARYLRWRMAPRAARRSSAPVVAGSVAWTLMLGGAGIAMLLDRVGSARVVIVDFGAVALPALGLGVLAATIGWVELVRPRLGRVERAHDRAAQRCNPPTARRCVRCSPMCSRRRTSMWRSPATTGWVDGGGRPLRARHATSAGRTILSQAGAPVAAIMHDADVPFEAIELGASLAGAQLAAQRSTTLARSRADAVRLATGRLVRAGDRASAAVSALLADVRSRCSPKWRTGCAPAPARSRKPPRRCARRRPRCGICRTGSSTRDLEERGLAEVLTNEGVPRRRLATAVEMTCYLLAYDDAGAVFADTGDEIAVRRSRPPDAELVERVEVLGGRVDGTVATIPTERA